MLVIETRRIMGTDRAEVPDGTPLMVRSHIDGNDIWTAVSIPSGECVGSTVPGGRIEIYTEVL